MHTEIWFATAGLGAHMGGIGSLSRNCVRALLATGAQTRVRVISLTKTHAPLDYLPHEFRERASHVDCAGSKVRFLAAMAAQLHRRPAFIIYEHVDLAQAQCTLPAGRRAPHAIWAHGIDVWRPLPLLKRHGLMTAAGLFLNSNFTLANLRNFHQRLPHTRVVPLALEPHRNTVETAPRTRKPHLMTVGRLVGDRPKGHHEILAALPRVLEQVPAAHWHVIGDGPWRPQFERKVEDAALGHAVTSHGFVDDAELDALYRSVRAFCMPSFGEGFGLVYIEAMLRDVPCIVSNRDAGAEVIGDAGIVVDPDEPDALADALTSLLADPGDFDRLSERARKRVEHFRYERFEQLFRKAVDELLEPPC